MCLYGCVFECPCVCLSVCLIFCLICASLCPSAAKSYLRVCVSVCVWGSVAILAQAGTLPWSSGESSAAVVSRHPLKRGGSPLQGLSSASRTPPLLPRPFEGARAQAHPAAHPCLTTARDGPSHGDSSSATAVTPHRDGPTSSRPFSGAVAVAKTSSQARSARGAARSTGTSPHGKGWRNPNTQRVGVNRTRTTATTPQGCPTLTRPSQMSSSN